MVIHLAVTAKCAEIDGSHIHSPTLALAAISLWAAVQSSALMTAAAWQPWLLSARVPIRHHMSDWLPQPGYLVRGGSYYRTVI
ncbi:unnamed protein product, partial [Brenthis ino]